MKSLLVRVAMTAALVFAARGVVFADGTSLPANSGEDLQQSYALLTQTFYSKVNPQKTLDGARDALDLLLQRHGVKVMLPPLRATKDGDANVAEVQQAIERVRALTHDPADLTTYVAIAGMAHSLDDRWTTFFTPQEYKEFNDELDPAKISGIGVMIEHDPDLDRIVAFYVVPGTPAQRAGLQPGDVFDTIDGKTTKGLTVEKASAMLRGLPGTAVRVTIDRDGKPLSGAVTIVRSRIQPPTVVDRMLPGKIGYIHIYAFGEQTADEFNDALDKLQTNGAKAYVLDLRYNGGGYVKAAVDISSRFVNNDPILTIEGRGSQVDTITGEGDGIAAKPTIVLVNKYTASASEITAGALQDDGIARLLGERTFGKGVMQTLTPLPGGAAIKITTAHYLTPKNRDINLKGLEPNITVAENKNPILGDVAHDKQLRAAIDLLGKALNPGA